MIRPNDDSARALERAVEDIPFGQKYIWRTVQDDKVRSSHAARAGQTFTEGSPPEGGHPGQDYGCRCWREAVVVSAAKVRRNSLDQSIIEKPQNATKRWRENDFIQHFYHGGGRRIALEYTGYSDEVIDLAQKHVFSSLKDQIISEALSIKNGSFVYETDRSYPFESIVPLFGGGVVHTKTIATVRQEGEVYRIEGEIAYGYSDEFTDPVSIRQKIYPGTSDPDKAPDLYVALTDLGGTVYGLHTHWRTKITGSVFLEGREPKSPVALPL